MERFIHTSTSETYGTAQYTPIDEHHPLKGQSPYSARKIGADKLAESYHLSYETPVVTVRPFNTYGPRQSARAIIPTIIAILGGGKEIVSEDQRYRPQASKVMELLCDAGKARELMGWEPQVSLKQGLALTVAFIRDHLDAT